LVKIIITRWLCQPGEEPGGIVKIVAVGEGVRVSPQLIPGFRTELAVNLTPESARFAKFAWTKF
jgi:hypothetical protein